MTGNCKTWPLVFWKVWNEKGVFHCALIMKDATKDKVTCPKHSLIVLPCRS